MKVKEIMFLIMIGVGCIVCWHCFLRGDQLHTSHTNNLGLYEPRVIQSISTRLEKAFAATFIDAVLLRTCASSVSGASVGSTAEHAIMAFTACRVTVCVG